MKNPLRNLVIVCALVFSCSIVATGQSTGDRSRAAGAKKDNVGVVIVKSAGKAAWATTKFVAKDVGKPIAVGILKPLALKVAPKAGLLALKYSGVAAKHLLPYALKFALL